MSDEDPSTFQRILVALDASPHSRAALDAAVRFARDFGAELKGLFVQEETLLRTAQLPFAQEVRSYTSAPVGLDDRRMKRQLRYRAEYAEWSLQQLAEDAEVPYDFEVVEGEVTRVLLDAAPDADLLVLGKTSTASSRRRLGTTSRRILSSAASNVLVLRDALTDSEPILTFYDGSESAERALAFAVMLSDRAHGRLTVLLPREGEIDADRLASDLRRRRSDPTPSVVVRPVPRAETLRLSAFARRKQGLVVFPAECTPLRSAPIHKFLYEIDRPLLVVRDRAAEPVEAEGEDAS